MLLSASKKEFKMTKYLEYNSPVILSFFFLSMIALFLNWLTKGKSNLLLFECRRGSTWNPLTYLRMVTHVIAHEGWSHLRHNFLTILLVGPLIEEKYGSLQLLIMILITSGVTGVLNVLVGKYRILGSSGIVFMLIILSSFVNFSGGKIPITLILICVFYIVDEILASFKKDRISHSSHLIGAICGGICGFYLLQR